MWSGTRVSRGTFYRHFHSKRGLLGVLARDLVDRLRPAFAVPAAVRTKEEFSAAVEALHLDVAYIAVAKALGTERQQLLARQDATRTESDALRVLAEQRRADLTLSERHLAGIRAEVASSAARFQIMPSLRT